MMECLKTGKGENYSTELNLFFVHLANNSVEPPSCLNKLSCSVFPWHSGVSDETTKSSDGIVTGFATTNTALDACTDAAQLLLSATTSDHPL